VYVVLFILLIQVSVNLIDIIMCKVLILRCVAFVSEIFTRCSSNKTNVSQEILTPSTLAFSCKVVHEKL